MWTILIHLVFMLVGCCCQSRSSCIVRYHLQLPPMNGFSTFNLNPACEQFKTLDLLSLLHTVDKSVHSMAESSSVLKDGIQGTLFRNWVISNMMIDVAKVELQKFTKLEMDAFYNHECAEKNWTVVKYKIHQAHRYGTPTIETANIQDSWALAKCYMPKYYKEVKTVEETDFSGLLHLVINNLRFVQQVEWDQNPGNPENVFCKARKVRNSIVHASPREITNKELTKNKKILVTMLKSLLDTQVVEAIEKIEKLEYEDISEEHVVNAFKKSLESLEMFKQELITDIPKINKDLKAIIPNEMETTSIAPEQNTTRTAQETQAEQTSGETITKSTSDLTELATKGERAIVNVQETGTTLINTIPHG